MDVLSGHELFQALKSLEFAVDFDIVPFAKRLSPTILDNDERNFGIIHNMNAKKFFVGAASLLVSCALLAATAPVEDAEWVAKGWLKDNAQAFGSLGAVLSVNAEKDDAGETLWYWVVMEKGAVVVAPDTEIEPVIAVIPGCDGTLPEGHPMRVLLTNDLKQRLAYAKSLQTPSRPGRLLGVSSASQTGATSTTLSKTATKWVRLKSRGNPAQPLPRLLQAANVVERPATVVKWLDGWNDVDDRITCWTQEEPFNLYTPLAEGPLGPMPSVVGCVATAGASVLHYFRVPKGEKGIVSRCTVDERSVAQDDGTTVTVGVTNLVTIGGTYDWSLFDEEDEAPEEEPEELDLEELAGLLPDGWEELPEDKLMEILKELMGGDDEPSPLDDLKARVSFDVGVLSHMSYSAGGSGAYGFDLAIALRKHFGLAAARYINANGPDRGNTTPIASQYYPDLVYNQIRAGSPVLFGIQSTTAGSGSGHEVVACGYGFDTDNTDYTFIFCGWAGKGDAWYALPTIDTKATAGGASATYDVIGEMIVGLSTNDCCVPLVGRVVDTDGLPVTNEWLRLENGMAVMTDTNGYWGLMVSPNETSKVIYDPAGTPHKFPAIGPAAQKPATFYDDGTKDAVKAEAMAEALPDALEFVIDRKTLDNGMELYGDYANAAKAALAKGKLLYVYGGATDATVDALRNGFQTESNEAFRTSYVFLQVAPGTYPALDNAAFAGAVDPRVFSPNARWLPENGFWTNTVEVWSSTNRAPVEMTMTGVRALNSADPQAHRYVLTVAYADGKTNELAAALASWSVDDSTMASASAGWLKPVKGAAGDVTVTADALLFDEETPTSASMTVTLQDGPCVIVGGCRTNTCVVAVDDDANVLSNKILIAQKCLVTPGYNNQGDDPVLSAQISFGETIRLESKSVWEVTNKYIFRCVGLEILPDGEDPIEVEFPNDGATTNVCSDYAAAAAVTHVAWKWTTDKYYVAMNADVSGGCKLDRQSNYYQNGSNLVISAQTGTGVIGSKDWVTVWRGCDRSELTASNATVKVDRVRDVYAWAVNVSDESVTNVLSNLAGTNDLVVARGYKIELVSVGEDDWGDPIYNIKVVRDDSPDPEIVEPGPIAFASIEKVEGEWVLVATNATQWCEYSLVSGTTLATNTWPEAVWAQWIDPAGPITNRVPVVDGEPVRFWVIRARPGLKPAE